LVPQKGFRAGSFPEVKGGGKPFGEKGVKRMLQVGNLSGRKKLVKSKGGQMGGLQKAPGFGVSFLWCGAGFTKKEP